MLRFGLHFVTQMSIYLLLLLLLLLDARLSRDMSLYRFRQIYTLACAICLPASLASHFVVSLSLYVRTCREYHRADCVSDDDDDSVALMMTSETNQRRQLVVVVGWRLKREN